MNQRLLTRKSVVLTLFLLPWIQACASVISETLIRQSAPSIAFSDLAKNPENYRGKLVILGGTVISVENPPLANRVKVLQRPFGGAMEPVMNDQTSGRFILIGDKPFDEKEFACGRKITVAAEVVGSSEEQSLDAATYRYPLLRLKECHIWPQRAGRGFFPGFHFGIGFDISGTL